MDSRRTAGRWYYKRYRWYNGISEIVFPQETDIMRHLRLGFLFASILTMAASAPSAELTIGDPAPDFELVGSDGTTYRLADFKGKRAVMVAWFPKAFTGG